MIGWTELRRRLRTHGRAWRDAIVELGVQGAVRIWLDRKMMVPESTYMLWPSGAAHPLQVRARTSDSVQFTRSSWSGSIPVSTISRTCG